MKILICSNSHGDSETMCCAVEKERQDMVIYLGDGIDVLSTEIFRAFEMYTK